MSRQVRSIIVIIAISLGMSCLVSLEGEARKRVISFMTWTAGVKPIDDLFKEILDKFMKEYPDIEVKEIKGESRDLAKLFTLFAGGVGPDVLMMECPRFPQIARSGVLEELTPFLKNDSSVSLDEWFPPAIEAGRWNGKLFGLPTVLGATSWVIYNPEIFDECGLQDPGALAAGGGWNLEAMVTVAEKATKLAPNGELERVGIHQMSDIFEGVQPWIWAMGGNIFNNSGDECKLDSEGAVKAISLMADMINRSKILSFGFRGKWLPTLGQESRFAMAVWWNNVTGYLREVGVPWPLAEVPFPPGPRSDKTVVAYVPVVGISKQCKEKDAAWELVKFLAGREVAHAFSRSGQAMAFRKDSIQVWGEGMIANRVAGAKSLLDGMQRMRTSERSIAYQLAVDEIHKVLGNIWAGKVPPESALPQLAKSLTATLKKQAQK